MNRPYENGLPFRPSAAGVRVCVRLTPGAAADALGGLTQGADGRPALQVRVTAQPIDGAANEALIALMAKTLKLRKSDVLIASGQTARIKILDLAGNPETIMSRLSAWVAGKEALGS